MRLPSWQRQCSVSGTDRQHPRATSSVRMCSLDVPFCDRDACVALSVAATLVEHARYRWRLAQWKLLYCSFRDVDYQPEHKEYCALRLVDGDMLIMGGLEQSREGGLVNDVWRSSNDGETWVRVCAPRQPAMWSPRGSSTAVVLPGGDVLLMGGYDEHSRLSDVWRSADGGATWTEVCHAAPWGNRSSHVSVVLADGTVLVMGGSGNGACDDVWSSADGGATWTQVCEHAGWSGRRAFAAVVLANGDIVIMGGKGSDSAGSNDVWKSSDGGATWTEVCGAAPWCERFGHAAVVLSNGNIVMLGSAKHDDAWWSADGGVTWTEAAYAAPWSQGAGFAAIKTVADDILVFAGHCAYRPFMWQCTMGDAQS